MLFNFISTCIALSLLRLSHVVEAVVPLSVLPTSPPTPIAPATASPLSSSISSSNSNSSSSPPSFADDLINKLVTASLYSTLFANGGDYTATCSAIIPENLSGVGSSGINGTAVKSQICDGASIVAQNADLGPVLREYYRRGAGFLAIALFAVRIVGGFAGGPDLTGLCKEIDEELLNVLFVGFTDTDVGSQVKQYICDAAAAAAASASASSAAAACPTEKIQYPYGRP